MRPPASVCPPPSAGWTDGRSVGPVDDFPASLDEVAAELVGSREVASRPRRRALLEDRDYRGGATMPLSSAAARPRRDRGRDRGRSRRRGRASAARRRRSARGRSRGPPPGPSPGRGRRRRRRRTRSWSARPSAESGAAGAWARSVSRMSGPPPCPVARHRPDRPPPVPRRHGAAAAPTDRRPAARRDPDAVAKRRQPGGGGRERVRRVLQLVAVARRQGEVPEGQGSIPRSATSAIRSMLPADLAIFWPPTEELPRGPRRVPAARRRSAPTGRSRPRGAGTRCRCRRCGRRTRGPRCFRAIAEHSRCQPGKPSPQCGVGHLSRRPSPAAFHRAKSAGSRLSCSTSPRWPARSASSVLPDSEP